MLHIHTTFNYSVNYTSIKNKIDEELDVLTIVDLLAKYDYAWTESNLIKINYIIYIVQAANSRKDHYVAKV